MTNERTKFRDLSLIAKIVVLSIITPLYLAAFGIAIFLLVMVLKLIDYAVTNMFGG